MTTEPSPSIICQALVKEPKDNVFKLLRSAKGAEVLWFAESSEPLDENKTVLWHWRKTNTSVSIQIKKIVPNSLITIKWTDTGIIMDLICEQITEEATLVTLKAYNYLKSKEYNFLEYKINLLAALKTQRNMSNLALKMLEDYYEFQKTLNSSEENKNSLLMKTSAPITD